MKIRLIKMKFVAILAIVLGVNQLSVSQEKVTTKEFIGTYDSRAIAVAFAGSPIHEKQLVKLREAHKKAKEAKDAALVAKLEAEGKARQAMAHQQAFNTAPVDGILAHFPEALAKIRKTTGVSAILSKWDKAGLKKHDGAETLDVTKKLIDAMQPNERQRKSAIEIQKHKPILLKEIEKIKK